MENNDYRTKKEKLLEEKITEERIKERSSKLELLLKSLADLDDIKYGAESSVADGGTITHGLGANPSGALVTGTIAGNILTVTAKSSTTITVAIKNHDGLAGTTQTVYWFVWK